MSGFVGDVHLTDYYKIYILNTNFFLRELVTEYDLYIDSCSSSSRNVSSDIELAKSVISFIKELYSGDLINKCLLKSAKVSLAIHSWYSSEPERTNNTWL